MASVCAADRQSMPRVGRWDPGCVLGRLTAELAPLESGGLASIITVSVCPIAPETAESVIFPRPLCFDILG